MYAFVAMFYIAFDGLCLPNVCHLTDGWRLENVSLAGMKSTFLDGPQAKVCALDANSSLTLNLLR